MRNFDEYKDPVGPPKAREQDAAPAEAEPQVGYGEDIAKGAAGGLGRGVAGTLGLPGTVGGLYRKGLSKLGVPDEYLDTGAKILRNVPLYGALAGPDAGHVQQAIESQTGKFYEPKTIPGQYASTIAEFAPGAVLGGGGAAVRAFNTVVPALASETAGQITKGTAAEPWARAAAGVVAGPAAAKLVTPAAPASAARQQAVATLEREGIPVSAGQRTGSKPIQWAESVAADTPGSAGPATQMQAAQKAAYDRAVTGRLYDRNALTARGVPDDVNLPDPRVATAGRASLEDEYTRLARANQLRSDPQLQRDMLAAQTNYERRVLPSQRTRDVEAVRNDIVNLLVQGQGRMPGDVYQATRSQLGTNARGVANQPYLAGALRDMRGALDRAMQRGLSPADARAWTLNNRRWGNMKQLDPAVAGATENLSPARVAQTARAGRNAQYAQQQGNLDELARAGHFVLKDLPQSGTGPRTAMQTLFNIPNALAVGGGGAGLMFGPWGALAGAALPFAASRAVVSGPGQRYLGNQLLPQHARETVAQALAQQAISQSGGIERNAAEREEYERRRKGR